MSNGQDCLCLIVTGATASPVPAPAPRNSNPAAPNRSPPPSIPQVPFNPQPSTPPPQTPQSDLVPTLTPPGMRPTLSAAPPSPSVFPSLPVAMMGVFLIYFC
ncbi:hypothetical protein SASPL_147323 [Salvia splendens]|uniref:Uncharacterized protein n=1 Tax=Salvia splendens TaxID=180675 RepID=A0A8X8WF07_SALSN|nr:hypothetical protein SASPL_147323 [Salvia splendens]